MNQKASQSKNESTQQAERTPHDSIYKAMFEHPEVLTDFLRNYVSVDFINQLDFTTFEALPTEFITEDMRKRYSDFIRKIHFRGQDAYLLLIVEFQSTIDPWIPVRVLAYVALLWLDLINSKKVTKETGLPPVFPIVLYSGEAIWKDPLDIAHLLSPVAKYLSKYQPTNYSLLVSEHAFTDEEINKKGGIYSFFLKIRRARTTKQVLAAILEHKDMLTRPELQELLKTILNVMRVLYLQFNPDSQETTKFKTLEEVENMLQKDTTNWKMNTIQEYLPEWKDEALRDRLPEWKDETLRDRLPEWKDETLRENLPKWEQEYKDSLEKNFKLSVARKLISLQEPYEVIVATTGLTHDEITSLQMHTQKQ